MPLLILYHRHIMIEVRYPEGWSFGKTDNIVDPEKQIYKLDRILHFEAESYSTCKCINRFIDWMRKWFTVQQILDWRFDNVVDDNPKNIILDTITHEDWGVEVIQNKYESLKEIAQVFNRSESTVKRWSTKGKIIKDWKYYIVKGVAD